MQHYPEDDLPMDKLTSGELKEYLINKSVPDMPKTTYREKGEKTLAKRQEATNLHGFVLRRREFRHFSRQTRRTGKKAESI